MMFADLVDLEDLAGQLKTLGVDVAVDAEPAVISAAMTRWLSIASSDQVAQARAHLGEFAAASEGLILPAAKALLESLITEISSQR